MASQANASLRDAISALIHGLRLSQAAMIEAAGKVSDRQFAKWCYQMANDRELWARELAVLAPEFDEGAEQSWFAKRMGGLINSLHEVLNEDDLYAALGDVIRIENAVLDQYEAAIAHAAEATSAAKIIKHQHAEICEASKTLVKLREQYLPDELRAKGRQRQSNYSHPDHVLQSRSLSNDYPPANYGSWSIVPDRGYSAR